MRVGIVFLILSNVTIIVSGQTTKRSTEDVKALRICNVLGGLAVTSLKSANTRNFFQNALDDVELLREYVAEAVYNGGIKGGLSNLSEMSKTLQYTKRGLANGTTTLEAGLAYADDRPDRRVERFVTMSEEYAGIEFVGNKSTDAAIVDLISNIFPWIVDRTAPEKDWYVPHSNGRTEGPGRSPVSTDGHIYTGAWFDTVGNAIVYYPPLRVYDDNPLTLGDLLGPQWHAKDAPWMVPSLPAQNPDRRSGFVSPYPDVAVPGLALISAYAPVYLKGDFAGVTYNDVYVASLGVDIALSSVAFLFDDMEEQLTDGSFAVLVDATTFNTVVISQLAVNKIYPTLTGGEEIRVTRNKVTAEIESDRRYQPYMPGDTIYQPLVHLDNADWKELRRDVSTTAKGGRGVKEIDITLTNDTKSTSFYAMYDRWATVADWALLVFSPIAEVEGAINATLSSKSFAHRAEIGETPGGSALLKNEGTLDIVVKSSTNVDWINLLSPEEGDTVIIKAGESIPVEFTTTTEDLPIGKSSGFVSFLYNDAGYPDCVTTRSTEIMVVLTAVPPLELNQIDNVRPVGLSLASLIVVASLSFATWVFMNRDKQVVRASQPPFLVMICVGTLLMGSAIYPLSIDDSIASTSGCDVACMAIPWLFSLGFTTAFSALFSKIWRINKIMNKPRFRRIKVTERDVLVPFMCLLTLNLAMLLAWTIVDPLRWERVPVDGDEDKNSSYGRCAPQGSAANAFSAMIITVDVIALVLANIQAYLARNISDELAESKYIGFAMASMLQVLLFGIPLLFLVNDSPTTYYIVASGIIFVICISILLLMFVPKILCLRTVEKNKEQRGNGRHWIRSQSSFTSTHSNLPTKSSNNGKDGIRLTHRMSCIEDTDSTQVEFGQYKKKVNEIMLKVKEQGVDVDSLFKEAGLSLQGDLAT